MPGTFQCAKVGRIVVGLGTLISIKAVPKDTMIVSGLPRTYDNSAYPAFSITGTHELLIV